MTIPPRRRSGLDRRNLAHTVPEPSQRSLAALLTLLLMMALATSGCGTDSEPRNPDGSDPLPLIELDEELRLGSLDGPEDEAFGRIGTLAVTLDGELWLLETQPHILRRFDAEGRSLGTSGREGQGPGELSGVRGIEPHPEGGVWVLDAGVSRLSHFGPDGSFVDAWPVPQGLASGFRVDLESGELLLHARDMSSFDRSAGPGSTPPEVWIRLDGDVQVRDSIPAPSDDRVLGGGMVIATRQGPVQPNLSVTLHTADHRGRILRAHNRSYAVLVEDDGRVDTLAHREARPLRKTDGEREELEAAIANHPAVEESPALDPEKPILAALEVDRDGRIWVQLRTEAVELDVDSGLRWREPALWHVWEPDGTPLGEVALPPGSRWMEAKGPHLWVLEDGPMGLEQVVRYRMSAPDQATPNPEVDP